LKATLHVASAGAVTSATAPQWRVEVRAAAHRITADQPVSNGGSDAGLSPFGLLPSGLAACTPITLRMYAERNGWSLAAIEVDVRYDVADDGQASITRTITVPAELPSDHRDRLAGIAERTPVTPAVRAGTPITTTLRTNDAAATPPSHA
jgi:putative redox protein